MLGAATPTALASAAIDVNLAKTLPVLRQSCSMALVDLLGGGRALDPRYSQKYLPLDRILPLSVAEMEEMLASW
eukprot:674189-Rhodomonas_salina.1